MEKIFIDSFTMKIEKLVDLLSYVFPIVHALVGLIYNTVQAYNKIITDFWVWLIKNINTTILALIRNISDFFSYCHKLNQEM